MKGFVASASSAAALLMLVQVADAQPFPSNLEFKGSSKRNGGQDYISVSVVGNKVYVTEWLSDEGNYWLWNRVNRGYECTGIANGDITTWRPHGDVCADAPPPPAGEDGDPDSDCVGSPLHRIIPDGGLDPTDPAWGPYATITATGEYEFSEYNTPKPAWNVKVHDIDLATGVVSIKLAHPGLPGEKPIVGKCVQPKGVTVTASVAEPSNLPYIAYEDLPAAVSTDDEASAGPIVPNSLDGPIAGSTPITNTQTFTQEAIFNHYSISVDHPAAGENNDSLFKLRLHGASAEKLFGANGYTVAASLPAEVQATINQALSALSDVECQDAEESDNGDKIMDPQLPQYTDSLNEDAELQGLTFSWGPMQWYNTAKKLVNAFWSQCGDDCWNRLPYTFQYPWGNYCNSWATVYTYLMHAVYDDETSFNFLDKSRFQSWQNTKTICAGYETEMECEPIRIVKHFGWNYALKCTKKIPPNPTPAELKKWDFMKDLYQNCPSKNPMKDPNGIPGQEQTEAFIAFNGSVGLDWVSNLNFIPVPYLGMFGHWGFHSEWKIHQKYTTLEDLAKGHPKITWLGHSRGGATANIAALWWIKEKAPTTEVKIVTAGGAETFFGGINLVAIMQFFCDYFSKTFPPGPITPASFKAPKTFHFLDGTKWSIGEMELSHNLEYAFGLKDGALKGILNTYTGSLCDVTDLVDFIMKKTGMQGLGVTPGTFHTPLYKSIPQYAYINAEKPCGILKAPLHDAVAFLNPIGHHPPDTHFRYSTWWCNAVKTCKNKLNCKWKNTWSIKDWIPDGSQGNLLPAHRILNYVKNNALLRPNSA